MFLKIAYITRLDTSVKGNLVKSRKFWKIVQGFEFLRLAGMLLTSRLSSVLGTVADKFFKKIKLVYKELAAPSYFSCLKTW